jgi:pilus assembly protein Flp/PilA
MSFLRKLLGDESGATAIEYGLIAALIAIVLVGTLRTVGANLKNTFNTVATSL